MRESGSRAHIAAGKGETHEDGVERAVEGGVGGGDSVVIGTGTAFVCRAANPWRHCGRASASTALPCTWSWAADDGEGPTTVPHCACAWAPRVGLAGAAGGVATTVPHCGVDCLGWAILDMVGSECLS